MIKHIINGQQVESRKTFQTINPATGEVIAEVASGGGRDQRRGGRRQGRLPGLGRHPGQGARPPGAQAGRPDRRQRAEIADLETADCGQVTNQTKRVLIPAPPTTSTTSPS
jgi:5-carboxymethyl-2-hydroxymuconic-semialdehyde dehydrogenase